MDKIYQLRYLPLFHDDLEQAVMYISNVLHNPQSAVKLIDDTEKAIQERLKFPLSFEPYRSSRNRQYPYYRIQVGNYYVFYVVIGDVMEVRRFIYGRRNIDGMLI